MGFAALALFSGLFEVRAAVRPGVWGLTTLNLEGSAPRQLRAQLWVGRLRAVPQSRLITIKVFMMLAVIEKYELSAELYARLGKQSTAAQVFGA